MPIVIGKANLRFSKSQFDIMENNKPLITKGFASLIGAKTDRSIFDVMTNLHRPIVFNTKKEYGMIIFVPTKKKK
jgi:flagellar assembly factor FliW